MRDLTPVEFDRIHKALWSEKAALTQVSIVTRPGADDGGMSILVASATGRHRETGKLVTVHETFIE